MKYLKKFETYSDRYIISNIDEDDIDILLDMCAVEFSNLESYTDIKKYLKE
jgi:hypothetical protein